VLKRIGRRSPLVFSARGCKQWNQAQKPIGLNLLSPLSPALDTRTKRGRGNRHRDRRSASDGASPRIRLRRRRCRPHATHPASIPQYNYKPKTKPQACGGGEIHPPPRQPRCEGERERDPCRIRTPPRGVVTRPAGGTAGRREGPVGRLPWLSPAGGVASN